MKEEKENDADVREDKPMTVGGEDVKMDVPEEVDMVNRDPNNINSHLKTTFLDIFAEPEPTTFSFDAVWQYSYVVFTMSKLWCYRITSLICALPAALCWGCTYACASFATIWCCVPCVRCLHLQLHCVKQVFGICLGTFVAPCYEAIGRVFSQIHITMRKE